MIKDPIELNREIKEMVLKTINFSNEIAQTGEYFEAGELLFSTAEIIENLDMTEALKLYTEIIELYKKLISNYKMQARLHEIAELYLRIADIYRDKFQDEQSEINNILDSIKFLKQESKLLKGFNETRKIAQNYQNIAELYFKLSIFKDAIKNYKKVIEISKINNYYDMLSFSYQQIRYCYEEIDDYEHSQDMILEGVDFFSDLISNFEEKNDNLSLAQIYQILKNLNKILDEEDQYTIFSKKEAGAYIDLAETLEKKKENYHKISQYYRGAGLCYQEIQNNLIECASCFILAGNFSEKIEDFSQAAINFFDGANVFKELDNSEMGYKHYIKAGDNYLKVGSINESTESYLNGYDIAIEGGLEFNKFGIYKQLINGLDKIAEEGLKSEQYFTAATLFLESLRFYEQLDDAEGSLLKKKVNKLSLYYYRAANIKNIGSSQIVQSYVLASIASILNGKLENAWKIISELEFKGNTVKQYKKIIKIMIELVSEGKQVVLDSFPYNLRRLIEHSEEILYFLKLFKCYKKQKT